MKGVFDTVLGTMGGIVATIGGFGCVGLLIPLGIMGVMAACCVIPLIFGSGSSG